jgi:2-desacetyl-2-hydroxyethyl bacteriochlorophyllide A dehydrogenase
MNRQILFTEPNKAELVEVGLPDQLQTDEVLVRMAYTAISAGTERANLVGDLNVSGTVILDRAIFPRALGYSGSGIVEKVGDDVKSVIPGDRVIVYFGQHKQYNQVPESKVIKIEDADTSLSQAALVVIACFSIEGVRKTRLEIGESALVAGLGILGLLAVQVCKTAGAVPVIAADLNPKRRQLAVKLGADYALDAADPEYVATVKRLTQGHGVNVAVEVTGVGAALPQTLSCMAKFGRVVLLGCTRDPVDHIDFYHQVHAPGVSLIGANNFARPDYESSPGNWTGQDDCRALLKLMAGGRLDFQPLINEIHSPADAPAVYHRLAHDMQNFPIGVLFDWGKLKGDTAR